MLDASSVTFVDDSERDTSNNWGDNKLDTDWGDDTADKD